MNKDQGKSSHGGRRLGAGRPKGAPNKATKDIREAAQAFTADAINTLASIMRDEGQPAAARVSAASSILDRGHGKPKQSVDIEADVKAEVTAVEWRIVDPPAQRA